MRITKNKMNFNMIKILEKMKIKIMKMKIIQIMSKSIKMIFNKMI